MKNAPTPLAGAALLALGAALLLPSCSKSGSTSSTTPAVQVPDFEAATFSDSTTIDNPYLPLEIGEARTFLALAEDSSETLVVERLDEVRVVDGVDCAVVRDRVWEDELLIEDTRDFYAQDDEGNVWYMGEEVDNFEYDDDGVLLGVDHEGSWEAGADVEGTGEVASPGYLMKADPQPGDAYVQEHYPGVAEDRGRVVALDVAVSLADGSRFTCLQIEDTTPLEPGVREYKYYASGLGLILEEKVDGSESLEWLGSFSPGVTSIPDLSAVSFSDPTAVDHPWVPFPAGRSELFLAQAEDESEVIIVERLDETRIVMGIECIVVRDRVFQEELLIEDTHDWFAQDDDGNLWYMGEEVDNYEYDDEGNLIGINHESAWEAGLDVNGAGTIALPGHLMPRRPAPGTSYHQEYYEDEAEDMAWVVASGVEVELEDGSVHGDCLQTLEWNPLDPGVFEHKFFVPGLGLVVEEKLGAEERVERRGSILRGEDAIPDFSAALFSDPATIDHELLAFQVGKTRTYTAETEDGVETIIVESLADTRIVLGVECRVVRDRVFLEDLLIEDTHDWFAQDDDGNVWYMGEEVDNYEYDDEGNLIGVNHESAWEAGLDVNGSGSIAEPGYLVPAKPTPGQSYHQEFYEGEAEDMAQVVRLDAEVELSDGTLFEDCVQTLEWNPLDPGVLESKYYAAGVGLVLEEKLGGDEVAELVAEGR